MQFAHGNMRTQWTFHIQSREINDRGEVRIDSSGRGNHRQQPSRSLLESEPLQRPVEHQESRGRIEMSTSSRNYLYDAHPLHFRSMSQRHIDKHRIGGNDDDDDDGNELFSLFHEHIAYVSLLLLIEQKNIATFSKPFVAS